MVLKPSSYNTNKCAMNFRYRDSDDDIDTVDQETKQLEKLKQKIEERKKTFIRTSSSVIYASSKEESNENKNESVPEPIETPETIPVEIEEPKSKKPLKEKTSHEFKVLGINEFETKAKVSK